jgi:hypothetical protein
VTETSIRRLFERYEQLFERALNGKADMDEVTSVYASAFVGASPAGIVAGKNDDHLKQAMEQGYRHYRAIGTKMMRIRDVRISPIDDASLRRPRWLDRGLRPQGSTRPADRF